MTDREAFEAWAGKGQPLEIIPTGAPFAGDYRMVVVQVQWDGWQSALAYERSKAQQERKPVCHGILDKDCNYMMPCDAAICNKCGRKHRGIFKEAQPERKPIPEHLLNNVEWQHLGPAQQERKPMLASDIVMLYAECPTSDADMIEFAREVEAHHGIKDKTP